MRDAGAVDQAEVTELAEAVHPLAGATAGDTHLGGDVGNRTGLASSDESAAALDGQRGVTVSHGRVFLSADVLVVLLILPSEGPSPSSVPPRARVYNVMTRNN